MTNYERWYEHGESQEQEPYNIVDSFEENKDRMDAMMDDFVQQVENAAEVFPPGFMNVMQHLLVHLPYEAKVGGPIQYRWMYFVERDLKKLKATIGNKTRVEGCIAEHIFCRRK
jgi:hypothetical protein